MQELAKALVAAQKEMPAIKPDAVNPHFKSEFISLDHLLAAALPVLNKHGIAVAQFPSVGDAAQPTLTTLLIHESGDSLTYEAPLLIAKPDPQGHGSAITYMRRYALAAALGISDEKDDDANAATPRDGKSQEAPRVGANDAGSSGRGGSPSSPPAAPATQDGVFRFPSGKHAGKTLEEAGREYCMWYAINGPRDDVKAAIKAHFATPEPEPLAEDPRIEF